MSNSNSKMIVFASILGAILVTGLVALTPSPIIGNAQAQSYDSQYGYDSNYYPQEKNSHTDIQKINCDSSNINVNGIDISQIPEDTTTTANELLTNDQENGLHAANDNGLGDKINFDRNLVNVCVNINQNEQVKVTPPPTEGEEGGQDLAVANEGDDDVSILVAIGEGAFATKPHPFVGDEPISVAVGLFNADSNLDLAVTNFSDDTVSILLGNGDGTFNTKTDFGTGDGPNSVAVGLFNADSNLDLAVANSLDDTVFILLGNGDGTFNTKTDFGTGNGPRIVAVGDFDNT